MQKFGIPIEGLHTETGPGVFEAAIVYSEALEGAERAVLFKLTAKEIGGRFGIMPSFMANSSQQYPGCNAHIHQSLSDGQKNLFHDAKDKHGMSAMVKGYLAGQLKVLPELMPIYAPTVNSYKPLVHGFWAPVKPTWGVDNRTASFRAIPGSPKATRLETRCPGAPESLSRHGRLPRRGAARRGEKSKANRPADRRRKSRRGKYRALAAHFGTRYRRIQAIKTRKRFFRRRLCRTLRSHARMGMATVSRRGARLGV